MTHLRGWRADLLAGALVFAASTVWGSVAYARFVARGGHPFFYQSYFEPAVMTACGRGFLVAQSPRPPALVAFLSEQVDRFSCDQLPRDLQVGVNGLYQRPWRYLMVTVALAWRLLGISWSGLAPLFGLLFGATTVMAYAVCRQVTGRAAALLCAAAMGVSRLQLANLPNLRDYAKAPFTLALLLIVIALAVQPRRPRDVLLLALCYGVVMGVGYGFRSDLLVDLPVFFVAVVLFLPGGVAGNLVLKAGALGCFAAGFLAAAWPIVSAVTQSGGCQWHFVLLGLTTPFNDALGVSGGSYNWGHLYKDEYVWASVSSYAGRVRPDLGFIEYCSHEYDVASWGYLRHILIAFPADLATRACASAIRVLDLPFRHVDTIGYGGAALAAVFAAAASIVSLRLALFAVFVVAYFAGHPAIQFLPRHYFPFECLGWTLVAWAAERTFRLMRDSRLAPTLDRSALRRLVACAAIVTTALIVPLWLLRSYQGAHAVELLAGYLEAPASPLPLEPADPGQLRLPARLVTIPATRAGAIATLGRPTARFVDVAIDASRCRPGTTLTFRYDATYADTDFTRTIALDPRASGVTRLFEPVYDAFVGVDVSDPAPSCAPSVAAVNDLSRFPLLLPAQLAPGWQRQPQYQQLAHPK
jgi:hypothetical protein